MKHTCQHQFRAQKKTKGKSFLAHIGVCGGGVGGLTTAIALVKVGHEVTVFERTAEFGRIGADVNLTPNAVHALDGLGIGRELRKSAAEPTFRISRTWDTGEETSRLELADTAKNNYGAPQLTIHRADLLAALVNCLGENKLQLGRKAIALSQDSGGVTIQFADGRAETLDAVIGADGIHSMVRETLFGADHPEFTGIVSYRAVVSQADLDIPNLEAFTKWWGPIPEIQIVTFPLNSGRETFVFATSPQADWSEESWTAPGDVDELRAIYADFHPEARALLAASTVVTKSALYVRAAMDCWSDGHVTLLGDACHPMVPFMAQGACMAIEDGVVLSRALEGVTNNAIPEAFLRYENARKERTKRIQDGSRGNEWLKAGGNADWVYGYNAWEASLH